MKQVLLLALIATIAYSQVTAPACASSGNAINGWDDNGTCRYCHPTCATCSGSGADKCLTCASVATASANHAKPVLTNGTCACASGKFLTVKTAGARDFECADAATNLTATLANCPAGFGKINHAASGTEQRGCVACATGQLTCQTCDNTTAGQTTAGTVCSACFAASGQGSATCSPASGKKIIPFYGDIAACPDGYFDNSGVCTELGANCKTGTSATVCTECVTGHGLKADKSCEKCATGSTVDATTKACKAPLPIGCTEADATTATKCAKEKCDTTKGWAKNAEAGDCKCVAHKWKKETKADATKTPPVEAKTECADCTQTCADGSTCSADGATCTAAKPEVKCEDATQKDAGCVTCAKDAADTSKITCSKCHDDQNLASNACTCKGGADMEAWDKTNRKCVKCDAKCTEAGKTSCNLGSDGKGTCGAAPANTNGGSTSGSNGILISAVSMILAVILA